MSDFIKVKDKTEYDAVTNENDVRTDIKIGGISDKFIPNINCKKWKDECWLNINYPFDITNEVEAFNNGEIEIKLEDGEYKEKHKYYIDENGYLEYEIEIESKPVSNKIELDLDFSDGLTFQLQRELTQEEIEQNCERPENVVDSYAIYWKKKNNKYKTGKFCHIYRIKVIDKDGKWNWCKQNINGKVWTIEIPQEFLDNAVYPIVVDPILGYSTPGASQTGSNTRCYGNSHSTLEQSGNIITFHCAVGQVDGIPAYRKIKLVVHDCQQSDGNPTGYSPVEQLEFTAEVSDDNSIPAPEGNLLSANTKYWLAFTPYSGQNKVKYDSPGGDGHWYNYTVYADEFIDPRAGTYNTWALLFSIWVDYEAGGEEFVRTISDTIGITDALSKSGVFVRGIDDTAGMTDILSRSVTFIRNIVDTIGITDTLSKSTIFMRSIKDTIGMTDILSKSMTFMRLIINTIEITDVLSKSGTFVRSITDTINVSDILIIIRIRIRKIVDIIGITDILKGTFIVKERIVDSFSVSNIVQSIKYKKPKINKVEEIIRPTINEVRGIKNE